jgi:dihydrofolate synthase/folylpolyglutamate synthase
MSDTIRYLEEQTKFNSLDTIKQALHLLDLKIDPEKVIVVAGTNGKGTTCSALQTLLISSGKNVGFFSSPHLIKINERIKFNGTDISDEDFEDVFRRVHAKTRDFQLSYFEYLTLMAACYFFAIKNVDYAIFEVGLGGSEDASNAVPHAISVITSLAMDHEAVLGNNILEIASNKFGIIGEGNRVFHTEFSDERVALRASETAQKFGARLICAYPYACEVEEGGKYPEFFIKNRFGKFRMNLPGKRAAENISLAVTVFDHLIENAGRFLSAIENITWPCRMERVVYKNRDIFLSGDHNPHGVQSLTDILKHYSYERIRFVVGVCYDKNYREMLRKLKILKNSHIYLTETPVKTLSIKDYDPAFLEEADFVSSDPTAALDAAVLSAGCDDLVVVTGSLYLTGEIKKSVSL